jgi:hypothetical protein
MFATRSHARTALYPRARRRLGTQRAAFAATASAGRPPGSVLQPQNDVAKKLHQRGGWAASRKGPNLDKYRVNVVSEKMCADLLDYIGPTLARHRGCDLIDVFPGVGIWSRHLSDLLQPRSHILMEPDQEFYKPFLEPLVERPGTVLLPESGIVWEQLASVLTPKVLPHQVERKVSAVNTPERNDTLLVTMNLSMYPKRKFRTFDSLIQLVLFQMISSIRPGSLFQKYGLVRMLIWVGDTEKASLVPRTVQSRKKSSIEAEISTEYVCEVAGGSPNDPGQTRSQWYRRDQALDLESTKATLERMREHGFTLPPDREPQHVREYHEFIKENADAVRAAVDRPFLAELEKLEEENAATPFARGSPKRNRLQALGWLRHAVDKRTHVIVQVLQKRQEVLDAYADAGSDPERLEKAAALGQAWLDKLDSFEGTLRSAVLLQRDNEHVFHQNPPVLNWDRRYTEPLLVRPNEFYPKVPSALLDIQPKATAPILRDMGPGSNRGGDMFDLVLRGLLRRGPEPIDQLLNDIYPGAGEGVTPNCPSLFDPAQGGSPIKGFGGVVSRAVNEQQLVEITQAWMNWPFKPRYSELVSSTLEETPEVDGEESVLGNTGAGDF